MSVVGVNSSIDENNNKKDGQDKDRTANIKSSP
jgi:hypothetical protein